ncbi:MAG: hypothetical protein ACO1PB_15160 [Ramlibacter sp.]
MPQESRILSQFTLDDRLEMAGLPRIVGGRTSIESLHRLRHAAGRMNAPVLFSLFAEEVPDLVPAPLFRAQVLYFALPASHEALVPLLLHSDWKCYGELTGDPWNNAVFLSLWSSASSEHVQADGPLVSFRWDALDLSRAFDEGFAVLMFDCDGTLHCRGIVVGEELAMSHSACVQSSFQRPLRMHSARQLQERTRAVEGTGADPEGPPNGGHPIFQVLCSPLATRRPFDVGQLPPHKLARLPRVSWHLMSDAVIGWLAEVTHFPAECRGESPLVLKLTVMPRMYERIQAGNYVAQLNLVSAREEGSCPAYVLLVECGTEVSVVTMPACAARFRSVYEYWARVGRLEVAFENFRNGRLLRRQVRWLPEAARECPCSPEDGEQGEACGAGLRRTSASLVEAVARERNERISGYACGVTDQETWRREDD